MKTTIKRSTYIVVLTLCIVVLWSVSSFAWSNNQHYTNNTGQPAYDLTKILRGVYVLTDTMLNRPFADCAVGYFPPYTIAHWYNGVVQPGEKGHACFTVAGGSSADIIVALWTDSLGQFIGVAGPSPSSRVWKQGVNTYFFLKNLWSTWTGTGWPPLPGDTTGSPFGPFDVTGVQYAITDHLRPLEALNDSLLGVPSLTWIPLSDVTLDFDEERLYNLGNLGDDFVILVRFEAEAMGMQTQEMIQYPIGPTIPTLPEWGLIILTMLLLATAVWLMRKRRVNMTPA